MRPAIILLAKAPVPGSVKTRLTPPLTAEQAAQLHTAMVWDTIECLQGLDCADLELHTDVPTDVWAAAGVPQALQCEGDLGLKMFKALREAFNAGRDRAMVVGSDAPGLPREHLKLLLAFDEDVALGPTEDGGYYAVACRRIHPKMFDQVAWSTREARVQTIRAAERAGLTVGLGRPWFDVDTPEDLERMRCMAGLGRHTARMVGAS